MRRLCSEIFGRELDLGQPERCRRGVQARDFLAELRGTPLSDSGGSVLRT